MQPFLEVPHCACKYFIMLRFLLLTVSFISFNSIGQNQGDWRIGANFQLNHSFDKNGCGGVGILPGGCYEPYNPYLHQTEFTTGANVNYRITKNLELVSGLNITKRSSSYYYCNTDLPRVFYPLDYTWFYPTPIYTIETPFSARYYIFPNRFKMHVELGQIVGLPMRNFKNNSWNDIQLDVHSGIGVDYFMGRFQISAAITYRRNWQTILNHEIYTFAPNRFGAELRTSILLGKK